jgi:uncharacterized membrane protein
MKKFFIASALMLFIVFVACSPKSTPTTTTTTTTEPDAPKMMATTYSGEVQPLIQSKCTPCHLPSKGGNKANFENYESAKKYGADMVRRIELNPTDKGFMPFKHDKLSADEIAVFKKWVEDGMQEK